MLLSLAAWLVLSSDVSVKYIGTAGWQIRSGATTILVREEIYDYTYGMQR